MNLVLIIDMHIRFRVIAGTRICKHLKVHKIDFFFGFDFEICIISLLVKRNRV
jgi:hypothetical protein